MITYDELITLPHELYVLVDSWFLPLSYPVENVEKEIAGSEYHAYRFKLNGQNILYRYAKVTPKRVGHFVTLWQRPTLDSKIRPFDKNDKINWVMIFVHDGYHYGMFLFDVGTLVKRGIFSNNLQGGKRAIRVYAPWITPTSKQAIKTQSWQLQHFIDADDNNALEKFNKIIGNSIDKTLFERLKANHQPLEYTPIDLSQFSEQLKKDVEVQVIWADDFESIEDVTRFLDGLDDDKNGKNNEQ